MHMFVLPVCGLDQGACCMTRSVCACDCLSACAKAECKDPYRCVTADSVCGCVWCRLLPLPRVEVGVKRRGVRQRDEEKNGGRERDRIARKRGVGGEEEEVGAVVCERGTAGK